MVLLIIPSYSLPARLYPLPDDSLLVKDPPLSPGKYPHPLPGTDHALRYPPCTHGPATHLGTHGQYIRLPQDWDQAYTYGEAGHPPTHFCVNSVGKTLT